MIQGSIVHNPIILFMTFTVGELLAKKQNQSPWQQGGQQPGKTEPSTPIKTGLDGAWM